VVQDNAVATPPPADAEPDAETAAETAAELSASARRGERFHALMSRIVGRLPFGLSSLVAPSFLGFAVINGFTFSVDLAALSLADKLLHWPYAAAATASYLVAFALSFVLNRTFNFRSHGALGPQTATYGAAVAVNYGVFVLGIGSGLTALGVGDLLARLLSGACEGAYMYSMMRWVVFKDGSTAKAEADAAHHSAS
jgi:putative flippase GtrA